MIPKDKGWGGDDEPWVMGEKTTSRHPVWFAHLPLSHPTTFLMICWVVEAFIARSGGWQDCQSLPHAHSTSPLSTFTWVREPSLCLSLGFLGGSLSRMDVQQGAGSSSSCRAELRRGAISCLGVHSPSLTWFVDLWWCSFHSRREPVFLWHYWIVYCFHPSWWIVSYRLLCFLPCFAWAVYFPLAHRLRVCSFPFSAYVSSPAITLGIVCAVGSWMLVGCWFPHSLTKFPLSTPRVLLLSQLRTA